MINRREVWFWLGLVAVLLWLYAYQHQPTRESAPRAAPPSVTPKQSGPIDLKKHDGATIDFSSGHAVVKDSPAERTANAKAVKAMEEAAEAVTFDPPPKK